MIEEDKVTMGQASKKPPIVLVIDDEEAVREAVSDILHFEGVTVLAAVDGEHGLDIYATYQNEVDLILLDLSMPGMSGTETFSKIKKLDPSAKVILSSGFDESDIAQRLIGQGLVGFLQKPYKMQHLIAKVREYLD